MKSRRMVKYALLVAIALVATAIPAPTLADQFENGTKNCGGALTGKARARYNDQLMLLGPGSDTDNYGVYTPNDGLWRTQERWGEDGGGWWGAQSDPFLNFDQTYAYCVAA